jgi:hypothetical protein
MAKPDALLLLDFLQLRVSSSPILPNSSSDEHDLWPMRQLAGKQRWDSLMET